MSRTSRATSAHSTSPCPRRVEVEHHPVGIRRRARRVEPPLRHVQLDRPHLREPDERGAAVGDRVRLVAVGVMLHAAADPLGRMLLEVLLEERLLGIVRVPTPFTQRLRVMARPATCGSMVGAISA